MDRSYTATANAQASVIVQVESAKGFSNAAAIAATDGVDCVFIGPADFAASIGYLGNSNHPDVQTAIAYITAVCAQTGKAIGIYAGDTEGAKRYRESGMHFIALNSDVAWLTQAAGAALEAMN